jgi:hypothetical protein
MKRTGIFILFNLILASATFTQNTAVIRLNSGQRLEKGQKLTSLACYLTLQNDGNLVFYTGDNQPKWSTKTSGKTVTHASMQTDGNLVLYNNMTPVWASDTWNMGAAGGYFKIETRTVLGTVAISVGIYKPDGTLVKKL